MRKKKATPKKLSPAMERLVGSMGNQAIWGSRRNNSLQMQAEAGKHISECEAHLNRLNGEIMATVNGIIDSNPKLKSEDILKEAGEIVDANEKAKQKNPLNPPKK